MKSDSSTSSAESEDSDSDLKNQIKVLHRGKYQQDRIYSTKGIAPTLPVGSHRNTAHFMKIMVSDVSGPVTTTSMPTKSIPQDSGKRTIIQATLGKSGPVVSPITISSVLGFLVRRSVSLERGMDLATLVERYSSRLPALRGLKDPLYCSLRMLRASSVTMKDLRIKSSLNRWRSWGILSSGRCLTANITESHRTGNECSLSDILEDEVPDQYFLSQKSVEGLVRQMGKDHKPTLLLQ